MNKLLAEFLGTFFLILTIGVSVALGSEFAPFAIAAVLTAVIYMGGHVSAAHYNPAVSVAAWLRGVFPAKEILPYIAAQLLGGIAAAGIAKFLTGASVPVVPAEGVSVAQLLVAEFLFTFALASVILNVATSKDHPGNGFYGAAIGLTVLGGALAVGPLTGGAFNPAVAISLNLINGTLSQVPLYLLATFAGGAAAGLAFKAMNPDDA